MTNTGWICPKCGSVWSPSSYKCWTCNDMKNTIPAPSVKPSDVLPATIVTGGTGVDPLANKTVTRWIWREKGEHQFHASNQNPTDHLPPDTLDTYYLTEIFPGRKE